MKGRTATRTPAPLGAGGPPSDRAGRGSKTMRRLIVVCAVLGVLLLTAAGASAAGAGAVSYTQTFKDVTVTVPEDSVPCVGGTATVTITYNAVVHVTTR